MPRADSASLYGSKAPVNLGRMPAKRAPRAFGLRSESAPTGWYAGAKNPARARAARPKSGPVTSNKRSKDVQAELDRLERIAAMEAAEDRRREDREAHRPIMVGDVSLPKIGNVE